MLHINLVRIEVKVGNSSRDHFHMSKREWVIYLTSSRNPPSYV